MAEGVTVKVEPSVALDLENRIINLCQENPSGITDKMLQTDMPHIDTKQRVIAINRLLSQGRLEILKQGQQILYRLKDLEAAKKVKGADNEEKLIYQIIEAAGNKGIWIREIRFKSNLLLTQVNKILRNLESRKMIKSVKSVMASKKKVYMLYNLEPDRTVTGGAWYSEKEFESEFVEVLNQQCYRYLQQKLARSEETTADPILRKNASYATLKEIWKYINELGISKVELSTEDIETILSTLIYDGKVKKHVVSDSSGKMSHIYSVIGPLPSPTGLMKMPCGICPVFYDCIAGGVISPASCLYMKEWF